LHITEQVRVSLRRGGVRDGLGVVYCPHTTAAITINEHADPDVVHDMLLWLNRAVPQAEPGFRHGEGNSDSHIKASLIGSGTTVHVVDGDLVLGTWQGVFCGARPDPDGSKAARDGGLTVDHRRGSRRIPKRTGGR
jgi:secondary thiamine-phosphate synthase enzyme